MAGSLASQFIVPFTLHRQGFYTYADPALGKPGFIEGEKPL